MFQTSHTHTCTRTQTNTTDLQTAKITQYVQHSHISKTKKDRETDAPQCTASAGQIIVREKNNQKWRKHAVMDIYMD